MCTLIRKRLPSKERNLEDQMDKDDKHMRKCKSEVQKTRTSSPTIEKLVVGPTVSLKIDHMNQSYSDIDYLPMISGGFTQTPIVNNENLSSNHNFTSDGYFNPLENIEREKDVKTTVIKRCVIEIPITIIQNDSEKTHYKRS